MNESGQREIGLQAIKERFLSLLRDRESRGLPVDPPINQAASWNDVTPTQLSSTIATPIGALSDILDYNRDQQTLGFKEHLYNSWDENVLAELYDHASNELERYHAQQTTQQINFSLRDALQTVTSQYLTAKREPFKNNALGHFVRNQIPEGMRDLPFLLSNNHLKIAASVGKGVWATIPWIAIMDDRITTSTQYGEYIVYLFAEDMSAAYLTLIQGVTEANKNGRVEGHRYLRQKVQEIRQLIPLNGLNQDEDIHLTSNPGLGRDYQVSTVAYYKYDRDNLPSEEQLLQDLENLVNNYNQYVDIVMSSTLNTETDTSEEQPQVRDLTPEQRLAAAKTYISQKGFAYSEYLIENFYLSLRSKPFVILAGVSGTGKTKLVELFAEALGATRDNKRYRLIPVRPDWSDPADLIGFKDLNQQFRPGPLTEVLVEARRPENQDKPYFVCLDEMNLARVEHYFSDVLSILESQKLQGDQIVTDAVIRKSSLVHEADIELYGDLYIPDNVYLIGTVNMDETTHPFSKKVLDRANTIEFNYIRLDQYPSVTEEEAQAELAPNDFLRSSYLKLADAYNTTYKTLIEETTQQLVAINSILESIHSHVGFRIRDAICFYLIYNEQAGLMTREQALDYQLLQKILPRIQGSNNAVRQVLLQLLQITLGSARRLDMSSLEEDASSLWRNVDQAVEGAAYAQSARKIVFMLRRLDEDGFTSYWLS
ncbi:MrcB family domain-containing protein [Paenibacillus tarimensis]|uniref:MrcB family domain-containing protein n=1 Tax=Paenibacillus tarimensis TaxID=416012 RepID=UPI001F2D74FF|nr:DUF3578 domain-containing protein [Paenibacillus tarimensis]MCF2945444.1 DUF3578 domain-containing protein [Paenibacillus tarimensis]